MKRKYEVTLNDDERVILANMCRRLVIQLASSDAVLCPIVDITMLRILCHVRSVASFLITKRVHQLTKMLLFGKH